MKKFNLLFHRYFYRYALPFILAVSLTTALLWERDIPILSISFWGLIIIAYLYTKLKEHQSIRFIDGALDLDKKIISMFYKSENYLYIVTPYFLVGENRVQSIYKAIENGASVSILVNDEALMNKSTIEELLRLKKQGCTINQNPNLHSKIYLNEKGAITCSLNLNHNSVNKSLEVGHQTNNVNELKKIENIIKRYLKDENTKPFTGKIEEGFCIRTKSIIPLNPKKPISYSEWYRTNDRNGKYCHKCGKESEVTVSNPLCDEHK